MEWMEGKEEMNERKWPACLPSSLLTFPSLPSPSQTFHDLATSIMRRDGGPGSRGAKVPLSLPLAYFPALSLDYWEVGWSLESIYYRNSYATGAVLHTMRIAQEQIPQVIGKQGCDEKW